MYQQGLATQQFNGMITLNEVAAFIEELDESKSKEELVDKIMDEFEVDEETARTDVEGFVGALYEHGLVLDE